MKVHSIIKIRVALKYAITRYDTMEFGKELQPLGYW